MAEQYMSWNPALRASLNKLPIRVNTTLVFAICFAGNNVVEGVEQESAGS
jgi:hypothetical protein